MGRDVKPGSRIRSFLISVVLGRRMQSMRRRRAEIVRRLTARPHALKVFLQLDDPYSYLLACYLPELEKCYDVVIDVCLTEALEGGFKPRPDMLARYAHQDCERVARELGLPFLDKGSAPPVEHRRALVTILARTHGDADHKEDVLRALNAYWRGDSEAVTRLTEGAQPDAAGDRQLAKNQAALAKLGHYNPATIHYAGEWYWGVDRLHYLLARLNDLGACRPGCDTGRLAAIQQAMRVTLPVAPPSAAQDLPPLEFFFSFRSPYSYLAMQRVLRIADAFGLELQLRPVLPMVMRGMQVPRSKILYIIRDAMREADRLGIRFGKFADPVGAGIMRALGVYRYACNEKRERDFMLNVAEGIWARGIDIATDKGMRKITGRTGLFWPDAKAAMRNEAWRDVVKENRDAMEDSGSWGVPTLRLGDFVVWGQDRDWLLVRHIEELCDTGEGILI